jgi:hypothetical protein
VYELLAIYSLVLLIILINWNYFGECKKLLFYLFTRFSRKITKQTFIHIQPIYIFCFFFYLKKEDLEDKRKQAFLWATSDP